MANEQSAIEELRRLLDRLETAQKEGGVQVAEPTVKAAVAAYLAERAASGKVAAGAARNYRHILAGFCAAFGDRLPSALTAQDVQRWGDTGTGKTGKAWSSSTRHYYLTVAAGFLAWADHPVALHLPPLESRGADVVLTDDQFEAVLGAHRTANGGDFVPLMRVLRETGARPGEVVGLAVENVDWANGCAILSKHKTARKTGRKRVLYFNSAAVAVLEAQRVRYGSGPLFRTMRGNPYSADEITRRMAKLSARVGFRAIAYGAGRHSFATRALCNGIPDTVVAALLGHTDTSMIHAHYNHCAENSRVLRAAVEKATGKVAG